MHGISIASYFHGLKVDEGRGNIGGIYRQRENVVAGFKGANLFGVRLRRGASGAGRRLGFVGFDFFFDPLNPWNIALGQQGRDVV